MDKCLGVIPGSHKSIISSAVNLPNRLKHVVCQPGDVLLFNANLVHVGAINEGGDDHLRVQMKVTHRDDRDKIAYYENFNKLLKEDNQVPKRVRRMQRDLSCMFPMVSDMTQREIIRTSRGSVDGVDVGYPQKVFAWMFYGNKDFYDLPNAF
jgi:ectoine hydroxylase-related dioxygenase (phytanoyl-CoA dioxygenase family)